METLIIFALVVIIAIVLWRKYDCKLACKKVEPFGQDASIRMAAGVAGPMYGSDPIDDFQTQLYATGYYNQ